MKMYVWSVWKRCRMVGYINAYSEWDALRKAEDRFGRDLFIVRAGTISEEEGFKHESLATPK